MTTASAMVMRCNHGSAVVTLLLDALRYRAPLLTTVRATVCFQCSRACWRLAICTATRTASREMAASLLCSWRSQPVAATGRLVVRGMLAPGREPACLTFTAPGARAGCAGKLTNDYGAAPLPC